MNAYRYNVFRRHFRLISNSARIQRWHRGSNEYEYFRGLYYLNNFTNYNNTGRDRASWHGSKINSLKDAYLQMPLQTRILVTVTPLIFMGIPTYSFYRNHTNTVPITHRQRFLLINEREEDYIGKMASEQMHEAVMTGQVQIIQNQFDWRVRWVKKIVGRLDKIIDDVLDEFSEGKSSLSNVQLVEGNFEGDLDHIYDLRSYDENETYRPNTKYGMPRDRDIKRVKAVKKSKKWVVRVVKDDNQYNAMVLPNGEIFVYTGLLNLIQSMNDQPRLLSRSPFSIIGEGYDKMIGDIDSNQHMLDSALATVLAHEMSHHIARHASEKYSFIKFALVLQFAFNFISRVLLGFGSGGGGGIIVRPWMVELVVGLPFSRKLELEADFMGMVLMSRACFDPKVSIKFWKKMKEATSKSGLNPPQLLSTHPNADTRSEKMKEWMPQMMGIYDRAGCSMMSASPHTPFGSFKRDGFLTDDSWTDRSPSSY